MKRYRIEAESKSTFTRVVVPAQAESEMQAMKFAREYIRKEYASYGKAWRIQVFEDDSAALASGAVVEGETK